MTSWYYSFFVIFFDIAIFVFFRLIFNFYCFLLFYSFSHHFFSQRNKQKTKKINNVNLKKCTVQILGFIKYEIRLNSIIERECMLQIQNLPRKRATSLQCRCDVLSTLKRRRVSTGLCFSNMTKLNKFYIWDGMSAI